jgi:hypothetical protein
MSSVDLPDHAVGLIEIEMGVMPAEPKDDGRSHDTLHSFERGSRIEVLVASGWHPGVWDEHPLARVGALQDDFIALRKYYGRNATCRHRLHLLLTTLYTSHAACRVSSAELDLIRFQRTRASSHEESSHV